MASLGHGHGHQHGQPSIQQQQKEQQAALQQLGALLLTSAKEGEVVKLEKVLAFGIPPDGVMDPRGTNALCFACLNGHIPAIQCLLAKGANPKYQDKQGASSLFYACFIRDQDEAIRVLLDAGADAKLLNIEGQSALAVAGEGGHIKSATLLLGANAEVNRADKRGTTPLWRACMRGHLTMSELLIDHGADVNLCDASGKGPLFPAAVAGNAPLVELLLSKGANPNKASKDGVTPVMAAAAAGDANIMETLLAAGGRVDILDHQNASALIYAARTKDPRVVKLLIQAGCDPNITAVDGMTPLHLAAGKGKSEVVQYLLDGKADPNAISKNGSTPLLESTANGELKNSELLLASGASGEAVDLSSGGTALVFACNHGMTSVVRTLADAHPELINKGDLLNKTPLFVAAGNGHGECVDILLEKGADPNVVTKEEATPLEGAAKSGTERGLVSLLKAGAKLTGGSSKRTILHVACHGGNAACVTAILLAMDAAKEAGERTLEVDGLDVDGRSPLMFACATGCYEGAKTLVDRGADVLRKDKNDFFVITFAAQGGSGEIIRMLAEHGAPIDEPDKNQRAPIFFAAHQGKEESIKTLVELGAQYNRLDKDGDGPLFMTATGNKVEALKVLIQVGANINHSNEKSQSALHGAALHGAKDALEVLLPHCSFGSLDAPDFQGLSALYLAAIRGQLPIVNLLLEYGSNPRIPVQAGGETFKIASVLAQQRKPEMALKMQLAEVGRGYVLRLSLLCARKIRRSGGLLPEQAKDLVPLVKELALSPPWIAHGTPLSLRKNGLIPAWHFMATSGSALPSVLAYEKM